MSAFLDLLSTWLIWDRSAIEQGQLWRLLTGVLVHLSWGHALANLLGFGLWLRLEGLANFALGLRQRLVFAVGAAVVVQTAMLAGTDYAWCAGASATLYGLFTFTSLRCGWRGGVMLAMLLGWLVAGPQMLEYSFPVAVQAHWVGVAAGVVAAALFWVHKRRLPAWGLPA